MKGKNRIQRCCLFNAVLFLSCAALASSQPDAGPRQDGVYTKEQAGRGEKLYDEHCASCHGLKLEGSSATALAGEKFMEKWGDGKTVDDLYYITRTQMPYGKANTLTKQQYVDLVAYMLKQNGYPAGEQELPVDPAVLSKIKIEPRASGNKTTNEGGKQ